MQEVANNGRSWPAGSPQPTSPPRPAVPGAELARPMGAAV